MNKLIIVIVFALVSRSALAEPGAHLACFVSIWDTDTTKPANDPKTGHYVLNPTLMRMKFDPIKSSGWTFNKIAEDAIGHGSLAGYVRATSPGNVDTQMFLVPELENTIIEPVANQHALVINLFWQELKQ